MGHRYEPVLLAPHAGEPTFFLAMLLVMVPKLYLVD